MNNMFSTTSKSLILATLAFFSLSACGESLEAPEFVMIKAKQALVDVNSGKVEMTADATGGNGTDDLVFEGSLELAFDKTNEESQNADFHLMLTGDMKAGEQSLNGDIDVNFIILAKEYYIKLNKLSSSDETLTSIQPFINLYIGKWLLIAEDFIPENIRDLQTEDEAMKLKKKQMESLFVETKLFNVTKEYGVENLNGNKVYHYGLTPNMEGFKDYMMKAAIIDGRELTLQEIEESVKILSYINKAEVYIDLDDYYILKSIFQFTGEALSESEANLEVEIVVEGSDFNKSVSIKAPEGAENFNPLDLIMDLGSVPVPSEDSEVDVGMEDVEKATEDVTETDEAVLE